MADFIDIMETAVFAALETTLQEAVDRMRNEIPANRVETRAAVGYRIIKRHAEIGLRFRRNYRSYNAQQTYSAKLFRRLWRTTARPHIERRFPELLNQHLKN